MAIVLPSLFVLAAVVATLYLNHFVTEFPETPQTQDVESGLEFQSQINTEEDVRGEKYGQGALDFVAEFRHLLMFLFSLNMMEEN